MSIHTFTCTDCGETKSHDNGGCVGVGYGKDKNGEKICYSCCGKRDIADMTATGRATMYLSKLGNGAWSVSNWPGTLRFPVYHEPRKGWHNIARTRYDVWFRANGENWHGVQYGDNTQICHCRRLKGVR